MVTDKIQFELALVVLLSSLDVVLLAIAIIADVVAGARVVAGSHRPIQLCRLLLSAGHMLLQAHEALYQVLVLGQNRQLFSVFGKAHCLVLRRYLNLRVAHLGDQVPLSTRAQTLERLSVLTLSLRSLLFFKRWLLFGLWLSAGLAFTFLPHLSSRCLRI